MVYLVNVTSTYSDLEMVPALPGSIRKSSFMSLTELCWTHSFRLLLSVSRFFSRNASALYFTYNTREHATSQSTARYFTYNTREHATGQSTARYFTLNTREYVTGQSTARYFTYNTREHATGRSMSSMCKHGVPSLTSRSHCNSKVYLV